MSYWDHFQYSVKNCFGGHAVHRLHWRRRDEAWLEESLHAEGSGFVPVWQSRNLVSGENLNEAVVLSRSDLGAHLDRAESVVLLGEEKGRACFAVHLPSEDLSIPRQWTHLGVFEDLRRVGAIMDASGAALLAYARAITYWHQRNRFCGDCGSPAASAEGGHSGCAPMRPAGSSAFLERIRPSSYWWNRGRGLCWDGNPHGRPKCTPSSQGLWSRERVSRPPWYGKSTRRPGLKWGE